MLLRPLTGTRGSASSSRAAAALRIERGGGRVAAAAAGTWTGVWPSLPTQAELPAAAGREARRACAAACAELAAGIELRLAGGALESLLSS